MKIKHGNFKVMLACCTSGMCIRCRACGDKSKRKIVMHIDGLGKDTAEKVAINYKIYDAKVEVIS